MKKFRQRNWIVVTQKVEYGTQFRCRCQKCRFNIRKFLSKTHVNESTERHRLCVDLKEQISVFRLIFFNEKHQNFKKLVCEEKKRRSFMIFFTSPVCNCVVCLGGDLRIEKVDLSLVIPSEDEMSEIECTIDFRRRF